MENELEISPVRRKNTCKLYHALANIYMLSCVKAKLSKIYLEKGMKNIKDFFLMNGTLSTKILQQLQCSFVICVNIEKAMMHDDKTF